jgi:hypothetical protein
MIRQASSILYLVRQISALWQHVSRERARRKAEKKPR